jgi:hypothetical protein
MKHSALSSLSVLSLLVGTLSLVGCGGAFSMPDSVVASQGGTPPIVGSVFGGHAPIVGSHVYLLQPSTVNYGGAGSGATLGIATSILGTGTTTTPGGYPLHTNPATGGDPSIPSGWQYVITDSQGAFSLTGAYSCTAGQPVYVYTYGGNATGGSPITANNTGIVQLAILGNCPSTGQTNFGPGSADSLAYVYVNEVSTVAAAYVFQPFTTPAASTALASAIYVGTSGTTQAQLGIANAASTAAQLYDIQGRGGLSTATGEGEGHVANTRTQSGTPLRPNAGNGIVPQAVINTLANILADCVDSSGGTATQCTTLFNNATETGVLGGTAPTDIARATMNIARYPAGNYSGTVKPTAFMSNIYPLGNGTVPYLPRLTAPPNDFTIGILYPFLQVGGYGATNSDVEKAESIEVDQQGQIWITAQGGLFSPSADRWSPLGVANATNNTSASGNYLYGYVSIDGQNNAWTGNANSAGGTDIFFAGSNGSLTATYPQGYSDAYTMVTDINGNAYFWASNAGTGNAPFNTHGQFEMWVLNSAGTLTSNAASCNGNTGPFVYYCSSNFLINSGENAAHGAIEAANSTATSPGSAGAIWITTENGAYQISRVTKTGGKDFQFSTNTAQPEFPSLDRFGHAWIPSYATAGVIYQIATTGTTPFYTSTQLTSASTKATLDNPFGSAIDGNNNLWVTIRCGGPNNDCTKPGTNPSTLVEINTTNNLAISPPKNYSPVALSTAGVVFNEFTDPLNVAIDPSGNLWITNYDGTGTNGGEVVEIIGAAAPVVTPLSLAAGNNMLGTKP